MKSVDRRSFNVPAHRLWEIIREPGNQPAWNPKCVHGESIGSLELGKKFEVAYEWKAKRKNSIGEVLSFERERQVSYRYFFQEDGKLGSVDETFELVSEKDGKTTLIHTVDYANSGLPKWVRLLIGFINRFGKRMGPDPLEGLDDLLNP